MKVRTDLPREVRELEQVEIPMRDGVKLAGRLWLPADAEQDPVPGVLEYLPYRKDDGTLVVDSTGLPYIAGHGYATLRVDVRGSGASEGVLEQEYSQQELEDGVDLIAWIAAQPWCTGDVGIYGISWSGYNGLQVAALRPPALKGVISAGSTDDRYDGEIHYLGGCLARYNFYWACEMLGYQTLPPDPAVVGERWRDMWLARMEGIEPLAERWTEHQHADDYWRHGSVSTDYGAIECPVYLVTGWADGFPSSHLRLLEHLSVPRKTLIGPWGHNWPHNGSPGPAIGFLQDAVRFFDHCLKGVENGVLDGPALNAWVHEPEAQRAGHGEDRAGRWVGEPAWPSTHVEPERLHLTTDGLLGANPGAAGERAQRGSDLVGLASGSWEGSTLPSDQRVDDGRSLCFDGPPLEERVELLGTPQVVLELAADRPVAQVAVRLCAVAPDGASTLLSLGFLNLTHHESREQPTALEPGRRYRVTVPMRPIGQVLAPGQRLRLAISTGHWWLWPSPEPVTLTISTGEAGYVELPVRTPRPEDAQIAFGEVERTPPAETTRTNSDPEAAGTNEVVHAAETGRWERRRGYPATTVVEYVGSGMRRAQSAMDVEAVVADDPLAAEHRYASARHFARGDWSARLETDSVMTCDATSFHLVSTIAAYEGEALIHTQTWKRSIPRELT